MYQESDSFGIKFIFEDNDRTSKCDKFTHHTMIYDIRLGRCLVWRILCKSLGYAENVNTISGRSSHENDTYIFQVLLEGLHNCQSYNDIEIVYAILNPFFKCYVQIIKT